MLVNDWLLAPRVEKRLGRILDTNERRVVQATIDAMRDYARESNAARQDVMKQIVGSVMR